MCCFAVLCYQENIVIKSAMIRKLLMGSTAQWWDGVEKMADLKMLEKEDIACCVKEIEALFEISGQFEKNFELLWTAQSFVEISRNLVIFRRVELFTGFYCFQAKLLVRNSKSAVSSSYVNTNLIIWFESKLSRSWRGS